ncbi:TPA: phosphatase PAP2 family protein [Streptococcus agalactiae]|nr:phosphatase PAP2 family protein [Streptococcus agalactiae]
MESYEQFYAKLSQPFRKKPQLIILLNFLLKIVTGMMYILYPSFLIFTLWQGMTFQLWLRILIIPAVSFIALSYIRKRLDFPRPYEKWNIKPLIYKDTEGRSMPSRHVFSATMISMCLLRYYVYFGIVCLILSVLLAICRVIAGVHYPKDVIVGYLIGLILGLCLFI